MQREWLISGVSDAAAKGLAAGIRVNPITAKLLINRGIITPDAAAGYFEPSLTDTYREW